MNTYKYSYICIHVIILNLHIRIGVIIHTNIYVLILGINTHM